MNITCKQNTDVQAPVKWNVLESEPGKFHLITQFLQFLQQLGDNS